MDQKAVSTIELCLANEVLSNTMGETIAAKLWTKLESLYMMKCLSNVLYLKKKLYEMKMKEGAPIHEHLSIFNTIISDLLCVDQKLQEDDKALLLLTSLPPSYKHLVTMILYGKEKLDFKEVTSTLVSNKIRKGRSPEKKESSQGLYIDESKTRGRSRDKSSGGGYKGRSKSKGKSTSRECFFCKKLGHYKKDCHG